MKLISRILSLLHLFRQSKVPNPRKSGYLTLPSVKDVISSGLRLEAVFDSPLLSPTQKEDLGISRNPNAKKSLYYLTKKLLSEGAGLSSAEAFPGVKYLQSKLTGVIQAFHGTNYDERLKSELGNTPLELNPNT